MTDPNSRLELEEELRRLPRQAASPQFTGSVLARLEGSAHHRQTTRSTLAWAGAIVLILAAIVTWSLDYKSTQSAGAPGGGNVERLKGEHEKLRQELALLQREIETVPVVYLSGDENLDLVLDLGSADGSGRPAALAVNQESETHQPRPANYRN